MWHYLKKKKSMCILTCKLEQLVEEPFLFNKSQSADKWSTVEISQKKKNNVYNRFIIFLQAVAFQNVWQFMFKFPFVCISKTFFFKYWRLITNLLTHFNKIFTCFPLVLTMLKYWLKSVAQMWMSNDSLSCNVWIKVNFSSRPIWKCMNSRLCSENTTACQIVFFEMISHLTSRTVSITNLIALVILTCFCNQAN